MAAPLVGVLLSAVGITPGIGSGNGIDSLGRWQGVITAGVVVLSLAFAFATHVGAFGWTPDPFIDLLASLAAGVVFGRASGMATAQSAAVTSLTGRADFNTALVIAAHDRLDKLNAPPSPIDTAGMTVGADATLHGGK